MSLTICPAYDRPEEVKALFLEYTDFLLKSDPSFAAFLELQNYDREKIRDAQRQTVSGAGG